MAYECASQPTELDTPLIILANGHRRAVVSYFRDIAADVASVDELASALSGRAFGNAATVTVRLHHATLPRLDGVDGIDYDERSKTVRYHGHPELEALLDGIQTR